MKYKTTRKRRYAASMTVETALILSAVLLFLAAFIRHAYRIHDTVTGSMILEETIERARNNVDVERTEEQFAVEGSRMGNPRLCLGVYEIALKQESGSLKGYAKAGDWRLQLERTDIHPETFLRQQDALKKIKDRIEN